MYYIQIFLEHYNCNIVHRKCKKKGFLRIHFTKQWFVFFNYNKYYNFLLKRYLNAYFDYLNVKWLFWGNQLCPSISIFRLIYSVLFHWIFASPFSEWRVILSSAFGEVINLSLLLYHTHLPLQPDLSIQRLLSAIVESIWLFSYFSLFVISRYIILVFVEKLEKTIFLTVVRCCGHNFVMKTVRFSDLRILKCRKILEFYRKRKMEERSEKESCTGLDIT